MTELQQVVLGILEYVDRLCKENDIIYYLAYGTLLGAVRHSGFIPWDDDVDLWMPRKDYLKLLDILHKENDQRYVLSYGEYKPKGDRPELFQMRVLDKKVHIKRSFSAGEVIDSYPWIDIFALDEYPKSKGDIYIREFKKELFLYKVARTKNYLIKEKSFFGLMNRIIFVLHNRIGLFQKTLNEEKHINKAFEALTKYLDKNNSNPGFFCYAAVYLSSIQKCLFEMKWFGTPINYEFEGKLFYGPNDADSILKLIYNDYMSLPPIEKRVNTHKVELEYEH